MAAGERSVVVSASPEKIWAVLTELSNWDALTKSIGVFRSIRPNFRIVPPSIPGPGMRFSVSVKSDVMQVWEVTEWVPPQRFSASAVWCKYRFFAVDSSLAFTIAPVDTLDTKVDFRFALGYKKTRLEGLLSLLLQVDKAADSTLNNICSRFPRLVQNA
jgi:hypothetical protein